MTQAQEIRDYSEEVPGYIKNKNTKKRFAILAMLAMAIAGCLLLAWHWWSVARFIVTTDDAYTSADSVVISPRISGYVKQVPVIENERVRRGDVLVIIDNTEYQFRIDQARAILHAKEAAIVKLTQQIALQQLIIMQAKSSLDVAQAYDDRAKAIYQRDLALIDHGYVSHEKFDADKADLLAASANVKKAQASSLEVESQSGVLLAQKDSEQAELQSAQTTLSSARFDYAQTEIVAPIDGVMGDRNVQIGEYVSPGKHLFVLVPVEQPYIIANFKETQLERIRIGQPVSYVLDAYSSVAGHGVVQSFAPATGSEFALLPPQNATGNFTKIVQRVPVKIRLLNFESLNGKFRPGLSATVSIDTRAEGAKNSQ
ncbi:MAG TPA: HlyD family secretion protein [Spongiibacteraceae bacterium]|jgi:membrane fusion protein (multidrug efflux system)